MAAVVKGCQERGLLPFVNFNRIHVVPPLHHHRRGGARGSRDPRRGAGRGRRLTRMPGDRPPHRLRAARPGPAARRRSRWPTACRRCFWLDDVGAAPAYDPLTAPTRADLTVVGGGYPGLWTAVHAKRRDPGRRVVLLEAQTVGWAASGRNGGFCEASLTHGEDNGRSRWPEEYDVLERLGRGQPRRLRGRRARPRPGLRVERTGALAVAVEDAPGRVAARLATRRFLDRDAGAGRGRQPALPRRRPRARRDRRWSTRPGSRSSWRGWPRTSAWRSTSTRP